MSRTAPDTAVSFGIATAPQQVSYRDILQVWREADTTAQIEHAWLFDHLLPIAGDPNGPIFEGWTLLSALAAQTERLRLGLLVTSNRFRPPAMLAKIAATVDIVSDGRLDFGIGVGSRPNPPEARREYPAHGLPYLEFADAVRSLAESRAPSTCGCPTRSPPRPGTRSRRPLTPASDTSSSGSRRHTPSMSRSGSPASSSAPRAERHRASQARSIRNCSAPGVDLCGVPICGIG